MEWEYRQGPDFSLCYGRDSSDKRQLFGLYLGFAPSFRASARAAEGEGVVGGYKVTWYSATADDPAHPIGRETLVELPAPSTDRPPMKVHVWVYSASAGDLSRGLEILRNMKFR